MTPLIFLGAALAGGLGAAARFVLDGIIRASITRRFPVATILINVTGSLALGLLVGLTVGASIGPGWLAVVGTGFLGGYTTFSAASYETVRLLQERRSAAAAVNGLGTMVVATAAAGAGMLLGSLV